jgi:hypothetical protein
MGWAYFIMVILVSITTVDWPTFIKEANNILGRSPTRGIDAKGIKDQLPGYLAAIDSINNPNSDPTIVLKNAVIILEHVHLGFLIETTDAAKILEATLLRGTVGQDLSLFSGTLGQWKSAVLEFCNEKYNYKLRQIFNEVYLILRQFGLVDIFAGHHTQTSTHKTFTLT